MPVNDLAALFLGPKAENADLLERLLVEALRDHAFWRRNFHPEDGRTIQEADRRDPCFEARSTRLSEALFGMLGELKAGVPFFSPRYVGHMTADVSMAALAGYFAAMLYNPNNVSDEASPVTTRLEREACAELAAMIGYPRATQWSHLTSGGTVANFEALWAARSVKYLPVALHWAAREAGLDLGGMPRSLPELLNIGPAEALDLLDGLRARAGEATEALLCRHSLSTLGHQEFGRRLQQTFGDGLAPAVLLVPATAHYSWEKLCRALGIGSAQLVHVPVDAHFRMDLRALEQTIRNLHQKRQPILACVAVVGTTEEGAVDPLAELCALRERLADELGVGFHLHADAAYGGYAAAATRTADGARAERPKWLTPHTFRSLSALDRTDSVTVDPHKLGFVPYPAGAVCFRDRRMRTLSTSEAPYVFHAGAPEALGRHILEGSRPGAAAASVWLAHRTLPLDETGYGRLIGDAVAAANELRGALQAADFSPARVVLLPDSDLNIVCFAVTHESCHSLSDTNAFADAVCRSVCAGASSPAEFLLSRTTLRPEQYGSAIGPLLRELRHTEDEYLASAGLTVLRCVVMKPFPASAGGRPPLLDQLVAWLKAKLAVPA